MYLWQHSRFRSILGLDAVDGTEQSMDIEKTMNSTSAIHSEKQHNDKASQGRHPAKAAEKASAIRTDHFLQAAGKH